MVVPCSGVTTAMGAMGACVIRYDATSMDLGLLCHHNISSSDTVTMSHIHGPTADPATGNAPILITLLVAGQGPNSIYFAASAITALQYANITGGMTYVNVHTTTARGGLLRGPVMAATSSGFTHAATLDNVQAGNGMTISDSGVGLVKRSGSTLWVTLFHSLNILPNIGEHIHTSSTGGIVYSICGLMSSPLHNCTAMDMSTVNMGFAEISMYMSPLDQGGLYFNVHTAAAPGGFIKGVIQPVANAPPAPSAAYTTQVSFSLLVLLAALVAKLQ